MENLIKTELICEKKPPLVIIAYNRPHFLEQVIDAVKKQTILPDKIIAYVDGPKKDMNIDKINECLKILSTFNPEIIEIRHRNCNYGTARNILQAITETLIEYPTIVYLEDDTVPSIFYYETMCEMLKKYEEDKQIFSVSGYVGNYPKNLIDKDNYDFIIHNEFSCWGFATWRDRWFSILPSYNQGFLKRMRNLINFPDYHMLYTTKVNYYGFVINYPSPLWFDVFLKTECTINGYKHITTKTDLTKNLDDKTHSYNLNNSYKPTVFPSNTDLYVELIQKISLKDMVNYYKKSLKKAIKITLRTIYLHTLGWFFHKDMMKNYKLLKKYLKNVQNYDKTYLNTIEVKSKEVIDK